MAIANANTTAARRCTKLFTELPLETLTKALTFQSQTLFSMKSASSHPLPKNRLRDSFCQTPFAGLLLRQGDNCLTVVSEFWMESDGLRGRKTSSRNYPINRRRTNVQQLTCKIDSSNSFYYLFFSFVLIELKPFVLKGKVPGENYEKVWKSAKKCEKLWNDFALSLLPFSFSLNKICKFISGLKMTGVSQTSLLIFVVFARCHALTVKFWQASDHRKRQERTMNQSKTTFSEVGSWKAWSS